MTDILRFLLNFAIAAFWLYVFNSIGWISFAQQQMPLWLMFLVIAFVSKLVEFIVDFIYIVFNFVTCMLGCITLPFLMVVEGWIFLWGAAKLTGWFTINVQFLWLGLLMSIAYGLIRIPGPAKTEI